MSLLTDRPFIDSDPAAALVSLRARAAEYRESAAELESAWQDPNAGAPWLAIANELEKACERIERAPGFAAWRES